MSRRSRPRLTRRAVLLAALVLAPTLLALAGAVPGGFVDTVRDLVLGEDASPRALTAPPSVTLITPRSAEGVAGPLVITGTAHDDAPGVRGVRVRVDDGPWHTVPLRGTGLDAVPWALPLNVTPGVHVVEARATDGTWESAPARVSFLMGASRAPPTVTVDAPEDGAGFAAGDAVTLAGTVRATAPVRDVRVLLGDVPLATARVVPASGLAGTWSVTLPAARLGEGEHTLTVIARDEGTRADATSAPVHVRVALAEGARAPVTRVSAPAPGSGHAHHAATGCLALTEGCVRVTGTLEDPGALATGVLVSVDDASWASAAARPGFTFERAGTLVHWGFDWSVGDAYAGVHELRVRPEGAPAGVPVTVPVALSAPRALVVGANEALRVPSGSGVTFTATWPDGSRAGNASWSVDGEDAARSTPTLRERFPVPGTREVTAFARDAVGRAARASVTLEVTNRAPVARLITPPAPVTNVSLEFDASGSTDPDGTELHYRFTFGDGASTGWQSAPNASRAFPRPGAFTVTLAVRDAHGATATTQATVNVRNGPPVVAFDVTPGGPVLAGANVTFTDASHDPDGPVVTREWDLGDGTRVTCTGNASCNVTGGVTRTHVSGNGTRVTHAFEHAGVVTARLTAWDATGARASVTRSLVVAPVPPRADFVWDPPYPAAHDVVTFTDVSRVAGAPLVAWAWDFGDGNRSAAANPQHAFTRPGAYPVHVHVTDAAGAVAKRVHVVHVGNAPPDVAVTWTPESPRAFDPVVFHAVASDRDGETPITRFAFPRNASVWNASEATFTFTRAGTFPVTFTAWDALNATGEVTVNVTVRNRPPTVSVPAPDAAYAGVPVNLTGVAEDLDGRIVNWSWTVTGLGTHTAHGPVLSHAFPRPGVYNVTLTVRDDAGAEATAYRDVGVDPAPSTEYPPTVRVDFPAPGDLVRNRITVRGSAASVAPVAHVDVELWQDGRVVHVLGEPALRATGRDAWHVDLETTFLPNGDFTLVARVTDTRGASAVARVPFTVANVDAADADRIAVQIVHPAQDAVVNGTVIARGSAYHPAGLTSVRVRVDDGPWRPVDVGRAEWAFRVDSTRLENGPHSLTVRAYRGVDAYRDAVVHVQVENHAPALVVTVPPAGNASGIITVQGAFGPGPTGDVQWRVDRGVWSTGVVDGSSWRASVDTRAFPNGNHSLDLRAVAVNGLTSRVITYAFTTWNVPLEDEVVPHGKDAATTHPVPGLPLAWIVPIALAAAICARRSGDNR